MKIVPNKNLGSFVVKIIDNQNATWQGEVIWLEENKSQHFRSALELLKLIDGVIAGDTDLEIEGGSHEK